MNESSIEQPGEIQINAEDLGWKKGFRWPKNVSFRGVEYQDTGPVANIDCSNVNEHIYRSADGMYRLSINRFRDGRARMVSDPSFQVKPIDFHKPGRRKRR